MDCVKSENNWQKLIKCGNLMFIDTESNYEDSIKLCKNFNHELAVGDVKSSKAYGNNLKRLTRKIKKQFTSFNDGLYGIGLKFQRVNETFEGYWVNGNMFDIKNNRKIKNYLNLLDFDCSRVLVDNTSQSLEFDSCNRSYPTLCTELSESLSSTLSTKQTDTTNAPKNDLIRKNMTQTDNFKQNISQNACNLSTYIFLASLSLLAIMVILRNKYEKIKKDENDIYIEAEPVEIYRFEKNKSIMHEKEQNEIQRNENLRPPSNYVDL